MNLSPPQPAREKTTERDVRTDWIPFFKGKSENIYINDLALRSRRSPAHAAILNSKHTYAVGEELLSENGVALINQGNGNTLRKVFADIMWDWIAFGNVWVEVDPKNKVLFHRDATQFRVQKPAKGKDVDTALGSQFWPEIKDNRPTEQYPVTGITMKPGRDNYMVRMFRKVPEYGVYGLPDYVAALTWIDTEFHIANYNLQRFERGFMPSTYIGLIGEPPDGETRESYATKFREAFSGEDGYQKMVMEWLDSAEQKTIIERFEPRDGEFIEMMKLAVTNIISAHSWFASLSGIVLPGLLGDYKSLTVEYEAAISGVVIPRYQNPVLRFLESVLAQLGITAELSVQQVSPLTLGDKVDPHKVLVYNELRAEVGYGEMEDEVLGKSLLPQTKSNADNQNGDNTNNAA